MMKESDQLIRPFVLGETNWQAVKNCKFDVAVLPWGATEAHNYHLPYSTDNIQAEFIANESAKIAWKNNARPIVLPVVPFGVNTGQMDIKLCLNMMPSTQLALLGDIAEVLVADDVKKLLIINGHGGNQFKPMIRELSVTRPQLFVCCIDWWKVVDPYQYFVEPGDHAGELETSCILHIAENLVESLETAGKGQERKFRLEGLREGWVLAQRQWSSISQDTGVGDPANATAQKGADFTKAVIEKVASFICDLADTDLCDLYE